MNIIELIFRQSATLVKCNIEDMSAHQYLQDFKTKRFYFVGCDQCLKFGEKTPRQSSSLLKLIECADDAENVIKLCSPLQDGAFFDGEKFDELLEEENAQKIGLLSVDVRYTHSGDLCEYFDFVILQFIGGPSDGKYIKMEPNESDFVFISATDDHSNATKLVFTSWYEKKLTNLIRVHNQQNDK